MVRPGLLMDWEAAEINAALTDLRMLREQVGQLVVPPVDRPWMKLTAYDSGTGYYSWTEQDHNATGGFLDKSGGRTGTTTWQPAKELNGEVISSFPHYVRADRAVRTTTVGPLYYFKSNASVGDSSFVAFNMLSGPQHLEADLGSLVIPSTGVYRLTGYLHGSIKWPLSLSNATAMSYRPFIEVFNTAGSIEFDGPTVAGHHPSSAGGGLIFWGPMFRNIMYQFISFLDEPQVEFTISMNAAVKVLSAPATMQFLYTAGNIVTDNGAIYKTDALSYATYQLVG